jgi:GT2 family glycosyltransferase
LTPTPEKTTAPPRIAVVIVTSQQAALLESCLEALRGGTKLSVIVVDNGSDDAADLEARFPVVRFIPLPRNFGLTKALNIGIRAVEAEFTLFLAPEVEMDPGSIDALADTLETQAGVGAVCPRFVSPEGEPVDQVGDLPSPAQPEPCLRPALPGEQVAYASGQAMMVRSFFLRALRHIDERYGDYGSAIELCRQVLRANKTVVIHPTVCAKVHPVERRWTSAEEADRDIGVARFLSKHCGLVSGYLYLIRRALGALFTFRFAKAMALISLKKIDGG